MRPSVIILLFSLLQPVLGETQRAEQLYTSQGCAACHQINEPVDPNKVMVGPPLAAVGSRYADDPKGLETILTSLRQGGGGKWGQNEMPPQSHLTKEHSGQLARWIFTLRQEDGAGDNNKATQDPPKTVTHSPLIGEKRLGTVVQVTDTPLVYRTYLPGVSARAIAVGLPAKMGGISYAFSAAGCRLLYVWSGGFIDMEKAWTGHGGWYAGIIGERFYHAPAGFPLRIGNAFDPEENPQLEFKGYRLVEGQPRFLYEVDGRPVSQEMRYDASSKTLTLHFTTSNITEPIRFLIPSDRQTGYASKDAERHPGHLLVHPDKNSRFSIQVPIQIRLQP